MKLFEKVEVAKVLPQKFYKLLSLRFVAHQTAQYINVQMAF